MSERLLDTEGFTKNLPYAIAEGTTGGKRQVLSSIIRNLPNTLKIACVISPDKGILHVDDAGNERMQTNAELLHSAKCVLRGLQDRGMRPGDQVVLQVEDSPSFLAAFWGALLGGFVPTPLPTPWGFPLSEGMERVTKVCSLLDRFCIVTDQPKEIYECLGDVLILDIKELLDNAPASHHHRPRSNDVAILQFSSGSTGDPKGVMLTHKNILCAVEAGAMGFIDAAPGDYRPVIGFFFHVIKHKIWKDDGPGPLSKAVSSLSKSSFGNLLNRTRIGKTILDTLLVLSGNKVSVLLDLSFGDICMANWMPYSHVMGLIGFHLGPTATGFDQVTLKPKTFIENPALFLRLIDRYRVSFVPCPNFAVQWLTTHVKDDDINGIDLSCIRMMGNGSEPISPSVTRDFVEKFSKYRFDPRAMCMGYGMSEATVEISFPHMFEEPLFHRVDKEAFFREKIIQPAGSEKDSIELADLGGPIQCTRVRVMDDDDRILHENMVGHIQVQGPTVTKGYFNSPEANKDLFCDGWLRTGDMGFIADGRVAITGRLKDIIFVNGQNLYAHDIEEHIKKVPGMTFKEFAISGLRHYETDSEKIILFVRSFEPRDALASLLSRVNRALVADIGIIIDFLVPINEIPRTPTAKVKRFKLREQFENDEFPTVVSVHDAAAVVKAAEGEPDGELTEKEERLIDIWKDVMGVDLLGKFDNFFDMGGNSLKATKVASRIEDEFGIEIPVKAIFEHQNVESLAHVIDSMAESWSAQGFPPIQALGPRDCYDVSHAQKRLWFLDKVVLNSPFYNIPAAVLVENAQIDLPILTKALQTVVDRHESLRTTFRTIDDQPVQVIADTLELDIPVMDISSRKDQGQRLRQIVEEEKLRPFNLEEGPLFRAKMVMLSNTRCAFIFIMHHIISDGWSMRILIQETLGNYFFFLEGKPTPSLELPIQYRDFSHWQNTLIESEAIRKQEAYWLLNLKGELPVLNLPTDSPRPAIQTQNGATERMALDSKFFHRLKGFAQSQGVTQFMLTLAVFSLMLHKQTGQNDIIIGSPVANRNNTKIEPLIGFFVNMLPMRCDLSGNPKFTDFLDQIKQTSLDAYANQDYPFDKLVEILNPVRDMSRSPVFDVVFEYRDAYANSIADANIGDISFEDITGDDPMAKFDMFVTFSEGIDDVTMQFEYNADLFEKSSIRRTMEHLFNLIRAIHDCPDKRISEIEMLGPQEREQVIKGFNDTARNFPKDKCTHELFLEQVEQFPNKEALVFGDQVATYAQLNEMSNKIAHYLKGHGVGRGTYVAIMVERSFDMIAGALGILKAGGAYVPIESEYPVSRIRYMLEEIRSPVAIVHESLMDSLSDYQGHVLCMDRFWEQGGALDGSDVDNVNEPEDIAYVIYTSGSTGKPKGVMVPHVAIARLVKNTNYVDITSEDRFLQIAAVAFDAATLEFWGPLLNGGSLFMAKSNDVMSPDSLAELLLTNDITIIFLTVVLYNQLIDSRPDSISKLKRLLVGGEALSVNHIKKGLLYTRPGVLANGYGPTENTTFSNYYPIESVPDNATSIPIGFPVANSTVYILDKYLKPAPVGVPGEIYIGGYGLAKGYLNDPEKTRNAFIENPMPDVDDPVLYKTGDMGRWLPDGSVDFMGRIDHQVKIRGHRIELGEIETVLRDHDGIRDCVVVVNNLEASNKMLVAYYVSEKDIPVDDLRSALRKSLPEYMIPNLCLRLDALPLNRNGKVDRSALPEPQHLRPEMTTDYVEPSNEIEATIAEVWKEVLGIDKVGIFDNFFDLGGDSIIGLQVVSRLNQRGFKLQPKDILLHQTVAALSPVVDLSKGVEAEQGPVVGDAPLTPIQRWFFDLGLENEDHFNQSLMFKSMTPIDDIAFKRSLRALLSHHDALRMRFADGRQENKPIGEDVLFIVKDVGSECELDTEVNRLQASLDIVHGPVFGTGLYRKDSADYLVLVGHHLVVDGVSWRILLEDLLSGYGVAISGGEIALPDKTTSFKEWATKLEAYASGSDLEDEAACWRDDLSGAEMVLPIDHDRGPNDIGSSDVVREELSKDETRRLLRDSNEAYNTEVNDLLLTALMRALQDWSDQDEVVFDLEGHGREDILDGVDISHTVGWFTTIFPVVFRSDRNADLAKQIKYVKEKLHTVPHKGFNYGVLKYLRSIDLSIDTDISFNYLGQITLPGLDPSFYLVSPDVPGTLDSRNKRANLIDVICMVFGDRLRIDFIYSQNKHARDTMQRLADSFKEELSRVIAHCLDPNNFDITPSDFDLVDLDQEALDRLAEFK